MITKTEGSDLQYKFTSCYITTVSYIYKPKKLSILNERLFIEVKKILAEISFHGICGGV